MVDKSKRTYYYVYMLSLEILEKWLRYALKNKDNRHVGYILDAQDFLTGIIFSQKTLKKCIDFFEKNINDSNDKQIVLNDLRSIYRV